ncbi:MAG: hypothetical protein FWD19_06080 [Defluviitaleaceae bacterium]|nr:hypothetical protein [Defluviitaleaceae bacterium]
MLDFFYEVIFIPLWPLGIIFPMLATIFFFEKRKKIIFFVPFFSTAIWALPRFFLLRDAKFEEEALEILGNLQALVMFGAIALTLLVFVLSVLTTLITFFVLKKIGEKK